jgi:hypothetical protein
MPTFTFSGIFGHDADAKSILTFEQAASHFGFDYEDTGLTIERDLEGEGFFLNDEFGNGDFTLLPCSVKEFKRAVTEAKDGAAESRFWRSPHGRAVEYHEAFMNASF